MRRVATWTFGAVLLATSPLVLADGATTTKHTVEYKKTTKTTHHKAEATDVHADADNTGINKRDRLDDEQTAGSQSAAGSDMDLTRNIRRAVIGEKELSVYAHNVKIITENGHVTLKGPVRSEAKKRTVEAKAFEAAGRKNVTSEIEVSP